ncbi:FUSC family protein [Pararobbsia silviterrae]|nr:FUSC family protein [Pararobbsia silviterrae]
MSRWRRATRSAGDALTRHRPVWMLSFALGDTSLSEGLRAACASTSMLVVGDVLHRPDFAWAAIGAFWTCLADAAGSNRMRLASMAGFAVLSTLCGTFAAWASGLGIAAAALAVLAFSAGGAFGRIWGPAVAQVTILTATACVVMIDRPVNTVGNALNLAAVYGFGCVWATVLSLLFWRIHPFEPSRQALERAFHRLADVCRDCARLVEQPQADFGEWTHHVAHFRGEARSAIEAARAALERVAPSRTDLRDRHANLLIALADAEHVFSFLIGVSDACERQHQTLQSRGRVVRALRALESVLRSISDETVAAYRAQSAAQHRRFARLAARLGRELGEPFETIGAISPVDIATTRESEKPLVDAIRDALSRGWSLWRANLSWQAIGVRHAARCGVATTLGFLAARAFHLPFGYWATMAILLIMQPSIATTWPRSLERAVGSIMGGLIAAIIGFLIHSPIIVSIAVFPLIVATMALRPVSYSLFVMFLTPAFVLVADYAAPGTHELGFALARLTNNVLGCLIAFIATFTLWPSREPDDFKARLSAALAANLEYLKHTLGEAVRDTRALEQIRRAAGLASNMAEASLQRARLESLNHSSAHWIALTALALCRRVAGTAARAQLRSTAGPVDAAASHWVGQCRDTLVHAIDARATPIVLPAFDASSHASIADDAVHQVQLLATVVEQYVDGTREGYAERVGGATMPIR